MSYCRWSTDIKGVVSVKEILSILDPHGYEGIKFLREQRGAEISDWYIFWSCYSGNTKDSQVLSIWWSKGSTTDFTYLEVKDMLETNDWSSVGDNLTQLEFMKSCVNLWIGDVEEEYKDATC